MWQPQGFYNQYVLRTPVILSGKESLRGLYNYPCARIAVIHGSSFTDFELIKNTFAKREVRFIPRSWHNEPTLDELSATLRELEELRPDTIVAVGGGSVIDGAKICRLYYEFPYFRQGQNRLSGDGFTTKFIAVPTTIGSGAEVSSAAVFTDTSNKSKDMIVLHELLPEVVVYDDRYVRNSPKRLIVSCALDAMGHILEGYVSNIENGYMDVLAEMAFLILSNQLTNCIADEKERTDYSRLQYAGFLGGLIQNHCIVGATHAVAHQLTSYGYSHSEAVALLLGAVIKLNARQSSTYEKYLNIFRRGGFNTIDEFLFFLDRLNEFSGIAGRRIDLIKLLHNQLEDNDFFSKIRNDRGGRGNPVAITDDYICELVRSI